MNCNLCPRNCSANRKSKLGFCQKTNKIQISKVMLHYGEEPYLTSGGASGAIFFAGCNLKCAYCQNWQISNGNGKNVTVMGLVKIFKKLEKAGADNIDLVTPTHYSHLIYQALKVYKPKIPIIYNCGGYESAIEIEKMCEVIDIFLFDLKYYSDTLAIRYSSAPHYFDYATTAIKMAIANKPNKFINNQLVSGVAIRHLCLPNNTRDSIAVLEWIGKNCPGVPVSLMSQYVPMYKAENYPEINRVIKPLEYKIVVGKAIKLNLNAFTQDLDSATTQMLPDFCKQDKQFKF